jgi:adenine deaminase
LQGSYLCPGFIDGHVHIESSMLRVPEFARVVVPHGTTTVIADPHEIANILGLDGIFYMMESSRGSPLEVYFMLPSCVPSTELETAGSRLMSYDLSPLLREDWVVGVAEMMNYPGVLDRNGDILSRIAIAGGKRVDGHAPRLTGKDLNAYIAAGIASDHESSSLEEAREKLQRGMYVMIREGSVARNMEALLKLVTPENAHRCMLVSDDNDPAHLLQDGHMDGTGPCAGLPDGHHQRCRVLRAAGPGRCGPRLSGRHGGVRRLREPSDREGLSRWSPGL